MLYSFAGIGVCYGLPAVLSPLLQYYRLNYTTPLNFPARYGEKSWAVITGGTDGIGEAFAYALAGMGFNIVIIGRNREKLDRVGLKLKDFGVEFRAIQFDLAESIEKKTEFMRVLGSVSDLDVSILINNAGIMKVGEFSTESIDYLSDLININCAAHTFLTRFFLPNLLNRPQKSGIINVASVLGKYPLGYSTVYSASKAYHRAFSLSLQEEVRGKVDVLALCPGKVNTKMVGRPGERFDTVSAEEVVRSALHELGRTPESSGAFAHHLISFGGDYVPSHFARYLTTLIYKRFFIQHRLQEQERSLDK